MASRARLEGICNYRLWTTEELIEGYAWEAGRILSADSKPPLSSWMMSRQPTTRTGHSGT